MYVKGKVYGRFSPYLLSKPCSAAERAVAIQAERDTRPYVPRKTGKLVTSAKVLGKIVVYPGPYAGVLYRGHLVVDPKTRAAGFPIGNGEFRSRKNAKKVLSARKMHFQHGTAEWFAESKRANIGKWRTVAVKEITHGANIKS